MENDVNLIIYPVAATKCDCCGELTLFPISVKIWDKDSDWLDFGPYCPDCAEESDWCEECEELIHRDHLYDGVGVFEGQKRCHTCFEAVFNPDFEFCFECKDIFDTDDLRAAHNLSDSDSLSNYICEGCFEDADVSYCDGCGELFHESDLTYSEREGSDYCEECYPESPCTTIPDGIGIKPSKSLGNFGFGQEIEIECDEWASDEGIDDFSALLPANCWEKDGSGPMECKFGVQRVESYWDYIQYLKFSDGFVNVPNQYYQGSHYHWSWNTAYMDTEHYHLLTYVGDWLLGPLFSQKVRIFSKDNRTNQKGYNVYDQVNRYGIDRWAKIPDVFRVTHGGKSHRVILHTEYSRFANIELRSAERPGYGIVILSEFLRRMFILFENTFEEGSVDLDGLYNYFVLENVRNVPDDLEKFSELISTVFQLDTTFLDPGELKSAVLDKILELFGDSGRISSSFPFRHTDPDKLSLLWKLFGEFDVIVEESEEEDTTDEESEEEDIPDEEIIETTTAVV